MLGLTGCDHGSGQHSIGAGTHQALAEDTRSRRQQWHVCCACCGCPYILSSTALDSVCSLRLLASGSHSALGVSVFQHGWSCTSCHTPPGAPYPHDRSCCPSHRVQRASRAVGDQHLQQHQPAGLQGHGQLAHVLPEDAAGQLPSPPLPARLLTQPLLVRQVMLGCDQTPGVNHMLSQSPQLQTRLVTCHTSAQICQWL